MDDLISRQAVLKLLSTMPPEEAMTKTLLIQSVKQMDAAQPSGPDNLVKDSQGLAKDLVNDCISRQAAIDAIVNTVSEIGLHDNSEVARYGATFRQHEIIDIIEGIPSAQPERKRGKWEIYVISMFDGEGCRCSECGLEGVPYWDFCPNCGADMQEVDDADVGT